METNKIITQDVPLIIECHCGHKAHKYFSRSFINKMDNKVNRIFYRCENCGSRTPIDHIPEIDNCKTIDVFKITQLTSEEKEQMFNML